MHNEYAVVAQGLLALARVVAKDRNKARQRQLIEELLCNSPSRSSKSIHELTGAGYQLIKTVRVELGAAHTCRNRPPKSRQPHPHLNGSGHLLDQLRTALRTAPTISQAAE